MLLTDFHAFVLMSIKFIDYLHLPLFPQVWMGYLGCRWILLVSFRKLNSWDCKSRCFSVSVTKNFHWLLFD